MEVCSAWGWLMAFSHFPYNAGRLGLLGISGASGPPYRIVGMTLFRQENFCIRGNVHLVLICEEALLLESGKVRELRFPLFGATVMQYVT